MKSKVGQVREWVFLLFSSVCSVLLCSTPQAPHVLFIYVSMCVCCMSVCLFLCLYVCFVTSYILLQFSFRLDLTESMIAMDTEIVDYTNEDFSLPTQLDPSILFSRRPKLSSSESLQEMGANYHVSYYYDSLAVCIPKNLYVAQNIQAIQGRNQLFSSSKHSQEMGATNFFVSVNVNINTL